MSLFGEPTCWIYVTTNVTMSYIVEKLCNVYCIASHNIPMKPLYHVARTMQCVPQEIYRYCRIHDVRKKKTQHRAHQAYSRFFERSKQQSDWFRHATSKPWTFYLLLIPAYSTWLIILDLWYRTNFPGNELYYGILEIFHVNTFKIVQDRVKMWSISFVFGTKH